MNRREFLRRALSLAPAAIALPALAEIATRTFFLPPKCGWHGIQNTYTQLSYYINIREELIDAIYNVDPYKTPLFNVDKAFRERDLLEFAQIAAPWQLR